MILNHLLFTLAACATPSQPAFAVEKVADGVYAALRREAPGLAFDSNSIWIVNDEDVVVVDTNVAPSSARDVIAAMKKITNKPVTYVVNTHWHDDHHTGNVAYRDAFPGVKFVGQSRTATLVAATRAPISSCTCRRRGSCSWAISCRGPFPSSGPRRTRRSSRPHCAALLT